MSDLFIANARVDSTSASAAAAGSAAFGGFSIFVVLTE